MPTTITGTREDRLRRLDQRGQRCPAAGNTCIQNAVTEYTLMPVDPATGLDVAGAEPFTRNSCSKHRRENTGKPDVRVISSKPIPPRQVTEAESRNWSPRAARMRSLIGCTFYTHTAGPLTVTHVKYVVDDVRLTDEHGEHHMLRDVRHVEVPAGHNEATRTTADADGDQTESSRRVSIPTMPTFSG